MKLGLYLSMWISVVTAQAQHAYFPTAGTVLFDKTVHVKNLMRRHIASLKDDGFSKKYYSELMDKAPETAILQKKLLFNGAEMRMESLQTNDNPLIKTLLQGGLLDYQQTLYQNLSTSLSTSSFQLAGSPILLQDSLLKVKWKITDEYRQIAGYSCRRANGLTLDSVYVVAFYTDQIPLSVGPGTVNGLPGMILGLVVPEQHFNIYASEVKFDTPLIQNTVGRKRDKAMTRKEVQEKMREVMGRWMSNQQFNLLMAAMLL